ncbi:CPBP family intramembrane metalloprotease [Candidatus Saccharibacteria bacterium]|nr:CPBP family intramembrane metalloprotease [Candidatus Saccharibacteria bacterium]
MPRKNKARSIIIKILLCITWAFWVCGVMLLTQFVLAKLLSWLRSILPFYISSSALQMIYSALSYTLGFFLAIFIPQKISKKWHTSKSDLGLNELPTWTDIGLAPVGLIVYVLLAALITSIFSVFPWFNVSETQDVGFNSLIVPSDRVFAFISLVVIAPIAEELIFRGLLYQKIKGLFSKDKKRLAIIVATIITSVAFGFMHGQWNVGVNVFALSVVLCVLREITGSIYSGILVHMLKNAIAFYILYIATIGF